MKRFLLTLSVLVAFAISSYAQQDRIFTHWMFEKMNYNPGATAIKGNICGTLIYRNQWDKWSGAPNSVSLGVEGAVTNWNSGFGLSYTHDAIGFYRLNKMYVNYSYHLPLGNMVLGMGVGIGFINSSSNPNWVTPSHTIDQDALLSNNPVSGTQFDANFGLYLSSNDGWYAGVSVTQLPGLKIKSVEEVIKQHMQVIGGYRFALGSSNWELEPQARVATDFRKVTFDVNSMVYWNKLVYGGLSYRLEDAVGILLGVSLDERQSIPGNLMIGYSYDIPANKTLTTFNRGTHEIFLKFCMAPPKKPITKSVHPRWL